MGRALRRLIAALLLAVLTTAAAPALAQTFPKFTGLVVDQANVLPPETRAALTTKLEALQKQTGHQLVVATIANLEGYPIEDYGYRLGRAWGVGLKGADNGAILFIAPNEPAGRRGPRIEVGYGLEPVLTDAFSSVVINQAMIPRLKAGDIPGAMTAGTDALIAQLRLPDEAARARAAKAAAEFDKTHARKGDGSGPGIGIVVWLLIAGFVALAFIRRRAPKGGPWSEAHAYRDRSGSSLPIWLWAASEIARNGGQSRSSGWGGGGGFGDGGGSDGSWGGGGFTGGGGGSFGGGGASGDW